MEEMATRLVHATTSRMLKLKLTSSVRVLVEGASRGGTPRLVLCCIFLDIQ
jgi:hypothetical protein